MEITAAMASKASVARKASPAGTGHDYSWFPDWCDETCVIVASGPTARNVDLGQARGARFIAVNNSYQLCPWADVLYACDFSWWWSHKGVPQFQGIKVSISEVARARLGVCHVRRKYGDKGNEIEFKERGLICYGGNGGFQALNLAIQFGSKKIILVGFDMRLDLGLHWHKPHAKRGAFNPNPHLGQVERWRKLFDAAAPALKANGVRVINCSPISALKNYPKMTLEQALAS